MTDPMAPTGIAAGMTAVYLVGSVNFAIVVFRLLGRSDPRTRFSGNAGTSNVFRQAGWPLAALVLMLDVGRAMAVALLARHCWPDPLVPWAGLCLILGNHWPCWHGFRGGKGVASYIGFSAALVPWATVPALAVYLLLFSVFRRSFIGSFGLLGVLAVAGLMRWGLEPPGMIAVVATVGLIVWFHRGNISEAARSGS